MNPETILTGVRISALAYLALVLWLAVRAFNRRERCVKLALAGLFATPIAYLLSFGPACWITSRTESETLPAAYLPVLYAAFNSESETVLNLTGLYAGIGMRRTGVVNFPLFDPSDPTGYCICNNNGAIGEFTIYEVQGRWTLLDLLCQKPLRKVPASAVGGSDFWR